MTLDTSKFRSSETYGSHGRFLAAVGALSNLTLSSKRVFQRSCGILRIQHADRVARSCSLSQDHNSALEEHGTTILIKDLFANLPVRAKARYLHPRSSMNDKVWEQMLSKITALILSWHRPVVFQLFDQSSGSKRRLIGRSQGPARSSIHEHPRRFDSKFVLHILTQAKLIRPDTRLSWVPVSASTSAVQIHGVISLDPEPTKDFQFLSLGIEPLFPGSSYHILFDEINQTFSFSSFASAKDDQDEMDLAAEKRRLKDRRFKQDRFTNARLRGTRKGLDRWPKFYIRIDIHENGDTREQRPSMDEFMPNTSLMFDTLRFAATKWLYDKNMKPQIRNCLQ